jgi:hypothetical protein
MLYAGGFPRAPAAVRQRHHLVSVSEGLSKCNEWVMRVLCVCFLQLKVSSDLTEFYFKLMHISLCLSVFIYSCYFTYAADIGARCRGVGAAICVCVCHARYKVL